MCLDFNIWRKKYKPNTAFCYKKKPTLSRKFAPATRDSISSTLSRVRPSFSLNRSANLKAPPPVACLSIKLIKRFHESFKFSISPYELITNIVRKNSTTALQWPWVLSPPKCVFKKLYYMQVFLCNILTLSLNSFMNTMYSVLLYLVRFPNQTLMHTLLTLYTLV